MSERTQATIIGTGASGTSSPLLVSAAAASSFAFLSVAWSSVRGSQYKQGFVVVLRKRSSKVGGGASCTCCQSMPEMQSSIKHSMQSQPHASMASTDILFSRYSMVLIQQGVAHDPFDVIQLYSLKSTIQYTAHPSSEKMVLPTYRHLFA